MIQFGLIGQKLGHSFSRTYFTNKWEREGVSNSYTYLNFELNDLSTLNDLIQTHRYLQAFNVTIPFKEAILPFCSRLSNDVQQIGAANTILIHRHENEYELEAYNTDVIGFRASLPAYPLPELKRAMILGTGGSSKAVQFVLNSQGFETLQVSRQPEKGLPYHLINKKIIDDYTLIINTTPLGMYPNTDDCPDIPYHYLSAQHRLIDLIYNPEKTRFLMEGEKQGAIIQNGLQMLIEQAEAAWKLFVNLE